MTKSPFARCFFDFPWLWGIKQSWHHEEDVIHVRFATVETFDQDASNQNIWVYGKGVKTSPEERWIREDRYALMKAIAVSGLHQLGSISLNAASTWFSQGLEYVAISSPIDGKLGSLHVQIFRASRNTTFWDFLQQYDLCRERRVLVEGGRRGN